MPAAPVSIARPWASRVPDALDALVAGLQAAVAGTSVIVRDGPWLEGGADPQVIVIGFTGFFSGYQFPTRSQSEDFGGAAVTSGGVMTGLGAGIMETFTISCASIVRTGDTKAVADARRTAYNNVTTVARVITQPPLWMNASLMKATIASSHSLDYVQDRRGLLVFLPFAIEAQAFAQQ